MKLKLGRIDRLKILHKLQHKGIKNKLTSLQEILNAFLKNHIWQAVSVSLVFRKLVLEFKFRSFSQSIGCPVIPFHPFFLNDKSGTNMLLVNLFSLMINLAERILSCNLFFQSVAHETNAKNKSALLWA